MADAVLTVAVVGGGASGSLVASELLQQSSARRLAMQIWLFDQHGRHGAGQAYSTDNDLHLLNAPAGKMSARPDEPGHLIEWAQRSGVAPEGTGPATFLPRPAYRHYLRQSLADSQRAAAPSTLTSLTEAVTAIRPRLGQPGAWIAAGGRWVDFDVAVLASGHAPAQLPFEAPDVRAVIADPWQPGGLDRFGSEPASRRPQVFVVAGTGLTMVDVTIAVTSRFPGSVVHAISRHGLLPRRIPVAPGHRRACSGCRQPVRDQAWSPSSS